MTVWERITAIGQAIGGRRAPAASPVIDAELMDLPLQADPGTALAERRQAVTLQVQEARATDKRESLTLAAGLSIDQDDYQYRRLGSGAKARKRDLTPIQQDRMLEIAWYLWEQNPFAKRLITFSTDLILGEGITVQADDERVQEAIDATWNHRINQLRTRLPEFHNALELNGELILPTEVNPVTGRPILGFIDPSNVLRIELNPMNSLLPEYVVLRAESGSNLEGARLRIVHEDPATGLLAGEVFYHAINKLPNSSRGRSSLLALADWLDLYDQYLFAEVERLHLLSSFVWDYKVEGASAEEIKDKVNKLPTPKPGSVFGHNEKESLEARTPDLKAADRSEAGRMLRTHIAGSYGFPLSYLGEIDSNKATIEGQNDVMMKTPARKQREFAAFIELIVTFTVQQHIGKNRALYRDASEKFKVITPEIAAKDISRVGTVLASVVAAMDTAMANKTASRQLSVTVMVALLKHLGVDADPAEVLEQADLDAEEKQKVLDLLQADMAGKRPGPGDPFGQPGDPDDPENDDDLDAEPGQPTGKKRQREAEATDTTDTVLADAFQDMHRDTLDLIDRALTRPQPPVNVHVDNPVTVHPAPVTVEAAQVSVTMERGSRKVLKVERNAKGLVTKLEVDGTVRRIERDDQDRISQIVEE
jgi:hypothetical protein